MQVDEGLLSSDEELREIFSALTDMIMVIDSDGRYIRTAPTQAGRHAHTQDFLAGKTFYNVHPRETADLLLNYVRQALASKRSINIEYPLTLNDTQSWFSATVTPLSEDQVIWVARDITVLKQAENTLKQYQGHLEDLVKERTAELARANEKIKEEIRERTRARLELQASQKRFQVIVEDQTDLICRWSPDTRLTFVNKSFCQYFGGSEEQFIGESFINLVSPEFQKNAQNIVDRLINRESGISNEEQITMPDGTTRWILWRYKAIYGDNEDLMVIQAVGHDISDLKGAELAESKQRILAETLRAANLSLTQSLDLDTIFEHLLDYLDLIISFDSATIFLLEEDGLLVAKAIRGYERSGYPNPGDALLVSFKPDKGTHLFNLVNYREPKNIPDVKSDKEWILTPTSVHINSWLGVPLLVGEKVIGICSLDSSRVGFFTDEHVEITKALGAQAAFAIQNAQLYETTQKYAHETESLQKIILAVSTSLDFNHVIKMMLENIGEIIPSDSASIVMVEGDDLVLKAYRGSNAGEVPIGSHWPRLKSLIEKTLIEKRPINLTDIQTEFPSYRTAPHDIIKSILVTPLVEKGEVIGLMNLDSWQKGHFTKDHERMAALFASQVSITIENAHLYDVSQRQLKEQSILNEVNHIVTSTLDLEGLLELTYQQVKRFINTQFFMIVKYDSQSDEWRSLLHKRDGIDQPSICHKSSEGMTGYVIETRKPLFLRNSIENLEFCITTKRENLSTITRSAMRVPFIIQDKVIGVMGAQNDDLDNAYSKQDFELFCSIGSQIAVAFENAILYEVSQRQLKEQSILNEINHIVTSTLDLEELLELTYQQVHRFLITRLFMIAKYDEKTDEWVSLLLKRDGNNLPPIRHKSSEGLSGYVIQTRKPLYLQNLQETEIFCRETSRISLESVPMSAMIVPLIIKDNVIGAMGAQNDDLEYAYSKQDFDLFCSISNQIAVAFENALLYAEMEKRAIIDPLTELFNRRHFFMLASKEFERAQRYGKPLSVVMVDIDHFKKVNDNFGHGGGDQVLQEVGNLCRECLRKIDLIGRYGGEEFVVALPETNLQNAMEASERLRKLVSDTAFQTTRGSIHITISLGAAAIEPGHNSLENLLDCADRALYRAKLEGRNRVKAYNETKE